MPRDPKIAGEVYGFEVGRYHVSVQLSLTMFLFWLGYMPDFAFSIHVPCIVFLVMNRANIEKLRSS